MKLPGECDLAVIGAGISGIAAATAYLDAHPTCRLVLLEADVCPGGTWNSRRLYETFWSQIGLGMAEFSDMPMPRPPDDDVTTDDFMKAKHVTKYLEDYLHSHTYNGKSMRGRLVLSFKVQKTEKRGSQWLVHGARETQAHTIRAKKLIVATGLTSVPQMPHIPGHEKYQGILVHQESFGSSGVLESKEINNVTVLGGAKSAADMVYAAIKAGKRVNWLIRSSGSGPAAFVSGKGTGKFRNSAETGATRFLGSMSPSIFLPDNWWTWFIHRTPVGRWLAQKFWGIATSKSRAVFESDIQAKDGFMALKPSVNVQRANDTLGLILQDDFWPEVAQNAQVYRGDIEKLEARSIRLCDGTEIPSDAILCGTGWIKAHFVFDHATSQRLGLPHTIDDKEDEDHWKALEAIEDAHVMSRFPLLHNPPVPAFQKPKRDLTPFRLYNLIAPIEERDDRSIAFVGCFQVPNAFRPSEIQAMWATAFLDGRLQLPTHEEMEKNVACMVAWDRRRYLNNGASGIYLHYDTVLYTDVLLRELGLADAEDRPRGWWADLTTPAFPRGLRPVREAFKASYGVQDAVAVG